MKFLNFFKTTLGITIIVLVVLAIIIIAFNWDAITTWWNDDADVAAPPVDTTTESMDRLRSNNSGQRCVRIGRGQCSYLGLAMPCAECTRRNIPIT